MKPTSVRLVPLALTVGSMLIGIARADVRLEDGGAAGGPIVRVHLTQAGAWQATGVTDSSVLNPMGDLHADGAPSIAAGRHGAMVAWTDAHARTALALTDGGTWRVLPPVSGARSGSAPRVASLGGRYLLARASAAGEVEVRLVAGTGALGEATALSTGDLVGLAIVGRSAHVLAIDGAGNLTSQVLQILVPDPDPSPFLSRWAISLGGQVPDPDPGPFLSRTVHLASGLPLPGPSAPWDSTGVTTTGDSRSPDAGLLAIHERAVDALAPGGRGNASGRITFRWVGKPAHHQPQLGQVSILDTRSDSGEPRTLALWWRNAQTLEFAVLLDGDVGPVMSVSGRGDFSQSLVKEALRLARQDAR